MVLLLNVVDKNPWGLPPSCLTHTLNFILFYFWPLKWTLQCNPTAVRGWAPVSVQEELTLVCIPGFWMNLSLSCHCSVPPSPRSAIGGSRVQSAGDSTVHFWSEIFGDGPFGDDPREKHGHPTPEADQQVGGWAFRGGMGGMDRRDVGWWQLVGPHVLRGAGENPSIWKETP